MNPENMKLTQKFIASINVSKQKSFYDKKVNGLILRCTKTGTKTWCIRYRENGKNKRKTLGRYPALTIKKARIKAQKFKLERLTGESQAKNTLFREIVSKYMDIHLKTLRSASVNSYKSYIKGDILPALGDKPVNKIKKSHVVEMLDQKGIVEGSKSSANNLRHVLSSIFSFGIKRDLCSSNPVLGTQKFKQQSRDRYYSESEIKTLFKAFISLSQPTRELFIILLLTGQRKSETLQMKWSQINGNIWTIPATVTKNKTRHRVPLGREVMQMLADMPQSSKYVFPSPITDSHIVDVKHVADKIKQNHIADFKIHDLRRTFATHSAKIGISKDVLSNLLNHKSGGSGNIITDIYNRYDYDSEKLEAIQKINTYLLRIATG